MAKILVVDDEPDICQMIRRYAEHEGYEVTEALNGKEAVALCREQDFDLVVMDIMMPEMDGMTACQEIRREKDIPMLMLSARGTEYDKLQGFGLGIDDYVVKPFSPKELMARIHVIINRHQAGTLRPGGLAAGKLRVDTLGRNVYRGEERLELTAKEYELLLYFMENKGIALSRGQILNAIWGYEYDGDDRTVDWQVKLLRGKLGACRDYLVTVRGVGYKFETEA